MQDRALSDELQERGAWATARQPQLMLSVRFVDGDRRSFSYTELSGTDYKKDVLALFFYQATIRIQGKGLDELADMVERQCVRFVREQHLDPFQSREAAGYVERIEIGPPNLEALSAKRRA